MADPVANISAAGIDPASFKELLAQLSNPDTAQRSQGEAAFSQLKERCPDTVASRLIELIKTERDDIKAFAATLLRQGLIKDRPSLWTSFSNPVQESIKVELLNVITNEPNRDVCFKVADIIAELFSKITGSECWPELIPFLCQRISQQFQDGFAKLAEICLYITAEIAPVLPDSMDHSIDQFIEMMKQSLHNPEPNIRLAAFKAIKSLALALENITEVAKLKVLMSDVLMAFSAVHVGAPDATEAYAVLIEIAQYIPTLFEDVLRDVLAGFLARMKESQRDANSKTMALEFLLTLVEGLTEEQVENVKDVMAQLVALLMDCLLQIQDVPDWYMHCGGKEASLDFGEIHDLVTESFDRLASSLPGTIFLPLFSPYAQQWSKDGDWKKRHAVLSVIGQMAEGCSSEISESVMPLLEICTQGLRDPHVRVRWAACQALGLVADELAGFLSKDQRNQLILQLMQASVIDDPAAVAVQGHALRCVCNVVETSHASLKGPVLDEMVKWILQSLNFANETVNKTALDCLSSVTAMSSAPVFAKYYNDCMKAVFNVLNQIKDPTKLEYLSSVVDVMTQVGAAAGKACFVNEYTFIVDYLKTLINQSGQISDSDDRISVAINILNAASCICSIMKTDFDALDVFSGLLLEALQTEPKIETVSAEDAEASDEEDPFKIDICGKCFRIERMSLSFCSCGMKTAISMAKDLKHVFFPVLIPVLEAFFPAMDYKVVKDIQLMAIEAQPVLLECATERHRIEPTENLRSIVTTMFTKQWGSFMEKLGDMEKETNETSAAAVLEAVAQTIEILQGSIDPAMMHTLFEKLQHVFSHFLKLRSERAAVKDEELNSEEREEFKEEVEVEHEVFISIQKLIAAVLKHTSDQYFNQIALFVTLLHDLMNSLEAEDGLLESILTVMTDLCDFSQLGRDKYAADVSGLFVSKLDHPSHGIRQMSAFGLGVIAQKAPEVFRPMASSVLSKLTQVIEISKASGVAHKEMDMDTGMALDNVVATVGKIMALYTDLFSEDDRRLLVNLWLSNLPLRHDTEEALVTHAALIQAIGNKDEMILGRNRENMALIVDLLMEIFANDVELVTREDRQRISLLLKELEHENWCSQLAAQKMQKWTEEEKAQFTENMNPTLN